ncbi:MAG: hypothetical protein WD802_10415 [Gemmatimonadaceae bacterium]
MILRRMAGLAISTLLLQLNFASSDLVCAKHTGESAEAIHHDATGQQAPASKPDHDHGTEVLPAEAERDHEPTDAGKPCTIPAQRDCCQALVSCSMTLGLTASNSAAGVAVAHSAIAPSAAEAPAYLIRAPEPPPPKA